MIATTAEPMMRGARRPVHDANQAPNTIPTKANAFGGTVILLHRSKKYNEEGRRLCKLQLRFPSCKSHVCDDGWLSGARFRKWMRVTGWGEAHQEKTQCVQHKRETVEQESISPNQGVEKSLAHVLPRKLLLPCRVAVGIQTSQEARSLCIG